MKVSQRMNPHVIAIGPEETAAAAARMMTRYNVGALPVQASDGSLCGILTDRDLVMRCMALERSPAQTAVERVMTVHVASVSPGTSLEQACRLMAREQVRRLPVVQGRRLVGMLSLGDLSREESRDADTAKALRQITGNVKMR